MARVAIDIVTDEQEQVGPRRRDRVPNGLWPVLLVATPKGDARQRPGRVDAGSRRSDRQVVGQRRIIGPQCLGRGPRWGHRSAGRKQQRQAEAERCCFHA